LITKRKREEDEEDEKIASKRACASEDCYDVAPSQDMLATRDVDP
jgi:hypothetical protein